MQKQRPQHPVGLVNRMRHYVLLHAFAHQRHQAEAFDLLKMHQMCAVSIWHILKTQKKKKTAKWNIRKKKEFRVFHIFHTHTHLYICVYTHRHTHLYLIANWILRAEHVSHFNWKPPQQLSQLSLPNYTHTHKQIMHVFISHSLKHTHTGPVVYEITVLASQP